MNAAIPEFFPKGPRTVAVQSIWVGRWSLYHLSAGRGGGGREDGLVETGQRRLCGRAVGVELSSARSEFSGLYDFQLEIGWGVGQHLRGLCQSDAFQAHSVDG